VDEREFQILRALGVGVAVALAVLLQRLAPHAAAGGSTRVNVGLWAIDAAATGLVCGACACTVARWAADANLGLFNVVTLPVWMQVLLACLLLDAVSYAWHRANHVVPVLWRFHQVHHSDPTFTVSTALRFHPGELLLSLPLRLAAVAVIGAPVLGVVVFEIWFALANFFEHGDIALPVGLDRRLRRICVTPGLHRRHHGRHVTELRTNFGTIFTFWDRMLGTYGESGPSARVQTGLPGTGDVGTLRALAMPFGPPLRGR
jgi:sterol desaturase/sphingolipid hydroxylase (fatty acid hydroxylase superfamily)